MTLNELRQQAIELLAEKLKQQSDPSNDYKRDVQSDLACEILRLPFSEN